MPDTPKLPAARTRHYFYMADAMRRLEWDLHNTIAATDRIPTEWHDIARRVGDQPTERVCLRLDRDVMKFFRSMGTGYGPRINEVLRSFMHARLAGVIEGPETVDFYRIAAENHAGDKPTFGEVARVLGQESEAPSAEDQRRAERDKVTRRLRVSRAQYRGE